MEIRPEMPGDTDAISSLIDAAFAWAEHSGGNEAMIVERLRDAGALIVSLVAIDAHELVGHVALSPVTIDGAVSDWMGLGPLAVLRDRQRRGIGGQLVRDALEQARLRGAAGCVLLGDPSYYHRFGFVADTRLRYPGAPPEYFQLLAFGGNVPVGEIAYHAAFGS